MSAPMLDGEPWGIPATPHPPIRHPPNIADQYSDLLQALPDSRRAGLIIELAVGYYENWRPTRMEVADMIAVERGELALHRFIERKASGNYSPANQGLRHGTSVPRSGRTPQPGTPTHPGPQPSATHEKPSQVTDVARKETTNHVHHRNWI